MVRLPSIQSSPVRSLSIQSPESSPALAQSPSIPPPTHSKPVLASAVQLPAQSRIQFPTQVSNAVPGTVANPVLVLAYSPLEDSITSSACGSASGYVSGNPISGSASIKSPDIQSSVPQPQAHPPVTQPPVVSSNSVSSQESIILINFVSKGAPVRFLANRRPARSIDKTPKKTRYKSATVFTAAALSTKQKLANKSPGQDLSRPIPELLQRLSLIPATCAPHLMLSAQSL
jgi:hypothetical protein